MISGNDVEKNEVLNTENGIRKFPCRHCILLATIGVLFTLFLIFGQRYFEILLWWLDTEEDDIVCLIFIVLYIMVAFPFFWGYLPLNLIAGFRFGLTNGIVVSLVGIVAGLVTSYIVISYCCKDFVREKLMASRYIKAILIVLQHNSDSIKLAAIARLTPVPYGLQNAVFAVSTSTLLRQSNLITEGYFHYFFLCRTNGNSSFQVSGILMWKYVISSVIGLTPILVFNVYLGSTFRSLQDVLVEPQTSLTGYSIFAIQVCHS